MSCGAKKNGTRITCNLDPHRNGFHEGIDPFTHEVVEWAHDGRNPNG